MNVVWRRPKPHPAWRRRALLGLLLLAVAAASVAQDAIPTYTAPKARTAITVDGELDAAWEPAPAVELVFPWQKQTGEMQKTTARMLWDDQYLYVFYECKDADIVALYTRRDDPTYRDDAVEIFINPQPSQELTYYGLEMNAGAVLYDYVAVMPRTFYKRFQLEGVQLAVKITGTRNVRGDTDQGWNLELAVPLANFEILAPKPKPGDRWRVQLNRWDGVDPHRRLSMWVDPLIPNSWPHVPARFGWLRFGE